jgi:pyridoxamine 5'-phosphate oxidase family protein
MMFTGKEIACLKSQRLARLATVDPEGQLDVVPVGYEFDGQVFYIGGRNLGNTRKYRNLRRENNKVAFVVDDLESIQPWKVRGIRIYGTGEFVERDGCFGHATCMRITPHTSSSWCIEHVYIGH